jgi:hypothetical protein
MSELCLEVRYFHGMSIPDLVYLDLMDWIDDGDVGERMLLIRQMNILV